MWTPCQGHIKKNQDLLRNGNPKRGVSVFSRRGIENVKAMLRERFALVDWQEVRENVGDFLKPDLFYEARQVGNAISVWKVLLRTADRGYLEALPYHPVRKGKI